MACRKIAISIEEDLLKAADRLARMRRTSRSALISDLIGRAAKAASDRAITDAINAVFSDPEAAAEQLNATREHFRGEVFGDS